MTQLCLAAQRLRGGMESGPLYPRQNAVSRAANALFCCPFRMVRHPATPAGCAVQERAWIIGNPAGSTPRLLNLSIGFVASPVLLSHELNTFPEGRHAVTSSFFLWPQEAAKDRKINTDSCVFCAFLRPS